MMPRMSPRQTIPTTSIGVRRSMNFPPCICTSPNPPDPDADTWPGRTYPVTADNHRSSGIDIVFRIGIFRATNGWAAQYVVFFCAFHSRRTICAPYPVLYGPASRIVEVNYFPCPHASQALVVHDPVQRRIRNTDLPAHTQNGGPFDVSQ